MVAEQIFSAVNLNDSHDHCNCTADAVLDYHDKWFWIYLGIYVALVLFAGLMSGLTLGLLSLDLNSLKILEMAGTEKEKKQAKRITPLIKHHHLLLVTLLLSNALAVESMPLFMDKISNEITAIVVSVTAVLFFGEVLPQAICSRYGLAVGANLAPVVYFFMAIFFLISWPIAKILDCMLGKDHRTFFRRAEIKALVDLHGPEEKHAEDPLSYDEVLIIKGALELRDKVARDAMVPIQSVFMLDVNDNLDKKTFEKIIQAAHSRIPVYEGAKHNIVGVLLVKLLISIDPADCKPLRRVIKEEKCFRPVNLVSSMTPLYDLLNEFQKGKGHLAAVTVSASEHENSVTVTSEQSNVNKLQQSAENNIMHNNSSPTSDFYPSEDNGTPCLPHTDQQRIIGIITLEDVIEELLCEEIVDETDVYVDVHKRVLVARALASGMGGRTSPKGSGARGKSVPLQQQMSTHSGSEVIRPTTSSGTDEIQRRPITRPSARRLNSKVSEPDYHDSDDVPLLS